MGIVYEALQESLGRRVAIKVLSSHLRISPEQHKRFEREARSVARLEHPGIVPVYSIGNDNGTPYFVMKLINGQGIDQVLRELRRWRGLDSKKVVSTNHSYSAVSSALIHGVADPSPSVSNLDSSTANDSDQDSPSHSSVFGRSTSSGGISETEYYRTVARLGAKVARAIHYAHEQGVLHRDIKPSNLMLDLLGTVWITDFGLAKVSQEEDITRTGDFVGTLRYTSPEQLRGWSDPRSDVYCLGITLYELLAFQPAFVGGDRKSLLARIANQDPPRLRSRNSEVPRDLETIVHKAIAKEPSERYQSAEDFAADIERFHENKPILAKPNSITKHFRLWARRKPAVAALSSMLVIGFLIAFTAITWLWRRAESETRKVELAAAQRELAIDRSEAAVQALSDMILTGNPYEEANYTVHQLLLDFEPRLAGRFRQHPILEARLRHAIGMVLRDRSEHNLAIKNLRESLRLFEISDLGDSMEAATTREVLANVLLLQNRNLEACREFEKVIDVKESELGNDHPRTLRTRAFCLAAHREVDPRELSNDEILSGLDAIASQVRDRLDDEKCARVFLLARYYAINITDRLERFEISERYCRERLELQKELLKDKPDHPDIVYTIVQQAVIARRQKHFGVAIELLHDAQERTVRWFDGEDNAQFIDLMIEEAKVHSQASDISRMNLAANIARDLAAKCLEPNHILFRQSSELLEEAKLNLGRE